MKGKRYTDEQFKHILDVLIQYKKCVPHKEVSLSEASLKDAVEYFMKTGVFQDAFKQAIRTPQDQGQDQEQDQEQEETQ